MVKAINIQAIEAHTNKPWAQWRHWLDEQGAAKLPHPAIVKIIQNQASVSDWWAQSIAVAYEQQAKGRKPGERADGTFAVSVTRIIYGDVSTAHAHWCAMLAEMQTIADQTIEKTTISITPKRYYWRARFQDGSAVVVAFETTGQGKILAAIEHSKQKSKSQLAKAKAAWATLLGKVVIS